MYVCEQTLGVNIHSCLAVTTDGLVLGVLAQSSYNREKPSDNTRTHESKKVRLLEEKESYRWVQTLEKSTETLPEGIHVVTVCDREGDMYELFDEADSKRQAFLIRIVQNRKTAENEKILGRNSSFNTEDRQKRQATVTAADAKRAVSCD